MSGKIPEAVRRAIADPLVLGDQPAPKWTMPTDLPPVADVRAAISVLRAELVPAVAKDARWCLGKLRQRFGVGSDEASKQRWLDVLGKFPRDLLFEAVKAALLVDDRPTVDGFEQHAGLARRRTDLARVEAMLAKAMAPKPVAPFVREPLDVRLRTLLASAHRRQDTAAAARYERELAVLEGREVEAWALPVPSDQGEKINAEPSPPAITGPSPKTAAMLLRAGARFHRQRQPVYAELLDRQADALVPLPPDERIDIPEGQDWEAA